MSTRRPYDEPNRERREQRGAATVERPEPRERQRRDGQPQRRPGTAIQARPDAPGQTEHRDRERAQREENRPPGPERDEPLPDDPRGPNKRPERQIGREPGEDPSRSRQ